MSTSISVLSTTHPLVSTVWTSTLSLPDPARESPEEEREQALSEISKRSARKSRSNGSSRNSEALFYEKLSIVNNHSLFIYQFNSYERGLYEFFYT